MEAMHFVEGRRASEAEVQAALAKAMEDYAPPTLASRVKHIEDRLGIWHTSPSGHLVAFDHDGSAELVDRTPAFEQGTPPAVAPSADPRVDGLQAQVAELRALLLQALAANGKDTTAATDTGTATAAAPGVVRKFPAPPSK